jgi:hypothetical protein
MQDIEGAFPQDQATPLNTARFCRNCLKKIVHQNMRMANEHGQPEQFTTYTLSSETTDEPLITAKDMFQLRCQ